MARGRARARRGDRGASVLEVVTVLPFLLVVLLVVVQVLLTAVTGVTAQNAARTAARAGSLGDDGRRAGMLALNPEQRGRAQVVVTRSPGVVVAVVAVRSPRVLPLVPLAWLTMSRSATMPVV